MFLVVSVVLSFATVIVVLSHVVLIVVIGRYQFVLVAVVLGCCYCQLLRLLFFATKMRLATR